MLNPTSLRRTVAAFSGLLLLVASGVVLAKAPTKKAIDQALLAVPQEEMLPVREAEDALHAGGQQADQIGIELANARLDQAAAKSWVDASQGVSKALEASRKAADAANRTSELEDLAARQARATKTTEWRDSRFAAAKQAVSLQQTRLAWAKAEASRLQIALDLARLQVYEKAIVADVEGATEARAEAGRTQVKLAKQARIVNKERGKVETAERDLSDVTLRAEALDPNKGR
jgi:hypothetical protein